MTDTGSFEYPTGYKHEHFAMSESGITITTRSLGDKHIGKVLCENTPFYISKVFTLSGETFLEITACIGGKVKVFKIMADVMSGNANSLFGQGIMFMPSDSKLVKSYMASIYAQNISGYLLTENKIDRAGWFEERETGYVFNRSFNKFAPYDKQYDAANLPQLEQKGTAEEQAKWIRAKAKNNPYFRFVCGLSLLSPCVPIINLPPMLVNLHGMSEGGKTLLQNIGASLWGQPQLVQSFANTTYAIEMYLKTYNNLPLFLSELQTAPKNMDMSATLYQIAEGQSKGRGRKDGSMIEKESWRNVIVTSGEQQLLESKKFTGEANRFLDVAIPQKLFPNPSEYWDFISTCHGHVGKALIELIQMNQINVVTSYHYIYERLVETKGVILTNKKIRLLTAVLLGEWLLDITCRFILGDLEGVDFTNPSALDLTEQGISSHIASADGQNLESFALEQYEMVLAWCLSHPKSFNGSDNHEVYGILDDGVYYISTFGWKKMIKEYEFSNTHTLNVLKAFDFIKEVYNGHSKAYALKPPIDIIREV